jgi:hypothetical protein
VLGFGLVEGLELVLGLGLGLGLRIGLGIGFGFGFAIDFVLMQDNDYFLSLPATHPTTLMSAIQMKKQVSFDQQVDIMFEQCLNCEETIVEDEEAINFQVQQLDKLQSAINIRRIQLQTAKDQTAQPWNKGISCTIHADLRKDHVTNKHVSLDSLSCGSCKKCAFCEPTYGACWPRAGGTKNYHGHLPVEKWKTELDVRLGDPKVMAQLGFKSLKGKGIKNKRTKYLDTICPPMPDCEGIADDDPALKRQCTINLPRNVYTKDSDVICFSVEEKNKLIKLNELWFRHVTHMKCVLSTMEDIQHKCDQGDYLRKQLRWYCELVLDILVPRNGKAAFAFWLEQYTKPMTAQHHHEREIMLDTMVKIYNLTPSPVIRRVTFVQLCGMLSLATLNARFNKVCEENMQHWGFDQDWCPPVIKRTRYQAGGIHFTFLIQTHHSTHTRLIYSTRYSLISLSLPPGQHTMLLSYSEISPVPRRAW